MRKLKKIAAGLLASVLALGLLTSCSDSIKDVTGAAKNWSMSNTGKILSGDADQRMLTYRDEGTEKYIVRRSSGSGGGKLFIGSKEYGWLSVYGSSIGKCVVDHAEKTYEKDNSWGATKFQASSVDKALWRLLSADDLHWILAGINTYKGRQYYTEVLSASFYGAGNGEWLGTLEGDYSLKEYTFVLYYKSEEAPMPEFIRINGEDLNDAVVSVSDFRQTKYNEAIPAPYDSLLDTTGYQEGTVTK